MPDLNDLIDKTHFNYEENEAKAKQLEERILKVPGMSKSYLPKRKYYFQQIFALEMGKPL